MAPLCVGRTILMPEKKIITKKTATITPIEDPIVVQKKLGAVKQPTINQKCIQKMIVKHKQLTDTKNYYRKRKCSDDVIRISKTRKSFPKMNIKIRKNDFLLIAYYDEEKNQRNVGVVKFCQYLNDNVLIGKWYHMKPGAKNLTVWKGASLHEFDESNIISRKNVVVNGKISIHAWQDLLQNADRTNEYEAWRNTNITEIQRATADIGHHNLKTAQIQLL